MYMTNSTQDEFRTVFHVLFETFVLHTQLTRVSWVGRGRKEWGRESCPPLPAPTLYPTWFRYRWSFCFTSYRSVTTSPSSSQPSKESYQPRTEIRAGHESLRFVRIRRTHGERRKSRPARVPWWDQAGGLEQRGTLYTHTGRETYTQITVVPVLQVRLDVPWVF